MKQLVTLLVFLLMTLGAFATHLLGGNITYQCVGPNQYQITLTLYEDCATAFIDTIIPQTIQIDNDCGITGLTTASLTHTLYEDEISQLCSSQFGQSECNGNGGTLPGVYMHQFTGIVTLPADCDSWTFSYNGCCRNASVNGVGTTQSYYWEAVLNSTTAPCNNSPVITGQPVPYNCVNQQVNFGLGAFDPDGNTLVYSIIPAMTNGTGGTVVYNAPATGAVPIPGVTINPVTGTISFLPTVTGNYIVAVLIQEFDANGNMVGSIVQDFQFEIINCAGNTVPQTPVGIGSITGAGTLTGPDDLELCEGDNICINISFVDDPGDSVFLSSNVLQYFPNATFTQNTWIGTADVTICLTALPTSAALSVITINSVDNACPVVGTGSYAFSISIIASTFTSQNETICLGNGVQIGASGGSVFNWSLISGDPITAANFSCTNCADPIANPAVTSVYEVVSNLGVGCTNTDQITVTVAPDFTDSITQSSTTTCLNTDIQLDIATTPVAAYTYDWTGQFLNSTTIADPIITPTAPGTNEYSVIITSPQGCVKYDTIYANVAASYPPDVTVTTNYTNILCGDTILFNADLGAGTPAICGASATTTCSTVSSQQVIGTITGQNTTTSYPAPYGNWYANAKHQFLYTAAELQAMGFVGGKITALSFQVGSVNGTANYNDYQISIGCTGSTDLTTASWETGLTPVFGPQNVFVTTGWNTMTLATAYEWDGISNLVVEVCFDNLANGLTNNSSTFWTTTAFNSSAWYGNDNIVACTIGAPAAVSTNRPITRFLTCPTVPDPNDFSYEWTPSTLMSSDSIQNPYSLPFVDTTYRLVVTDLNGGCTDTVFTDIFVNCDTCQAPIPAITNVSCFGGADGEIIATPIGIDGPPFIVQLLDPITLAIIEQDSTVMTNTIFDSLAAGDYVLRSYDTTGCWADTLITITEPPLLNLSTSLDTISCIGGTATITATASGGNSNSYTYYWGGGITSNDSVQNVSPIAPTIYDVYGLDDLGCSTDTFAINVNMYPPILTVLGASDTVCPGETAMVSVSANGGYGGTYFYSWTDEFGNFIGNSNPQSVTPTADPTTYYVLVTDDCETPAQLDSVTIYWHEVPEPLVGADVLSGCYPVEVNFSNLTDPTLSNQCYWDFGNGDVSTQCGPNFITYDSVGTYDVQLTVTSSEGCVGDTTYTGLIDVYDYPVASFEISPNAIDVLSPSAFLNNLSSPDAVTFEYTILDSIGTSIGTSSLPTVEWTFPDAVPTYFDVQLVVTNQWGCKDTIMHQVIMDGVYSFYVPTGFTPNGDGVNDLFMPVGEGVDDLDYEMYIFDRWGEKIFETNEVLKGWDGTHHNIPSEMDVYVWKIYTKDKYTGKEHENVGHIMLIR